jgi:hypothetical protein
MSGGVTYISDVLTDFNPPHDGEPPTPEVELVLTGASADFMAGLDITLTKGWGWERPGRGAVAGVRLCVDRVHSECWSERKAMNFQLEGL